jgi:hypothetical protein
MTTAEMAGVKLPTDVKVSKTCSTDATRPMLNGLSFQVGPDGKTAITATDSYCLAIVPLEVPREWCNRLVPLEAVKAWEKRGASLRIEDDRVIVTAGGEEQTWPLRDGQVPKVFELIPGEELYGQDAFPEVGLNPYLLADLSAALGIGKRTRKPLRVRFISPLRPIRVDGPEGYGLLCRSACRLQHLQRS